MAHCPTAGTVHTARIQRGDACREPKSAQQWCSVNVSSASKRSPHLCSLPPRPEPVLSTGRKQGLVREATPACGAARLHGGHRGRKGPSTTAVKTVAPISHHLHLQVLRIIRHFQNVGLRCCEFIYTGVKLSPYMQHINADQNQCWHSLTVHSPERGAPHSQGNRANPSQLQAAARSHCSDITQPWCHKPQWPGTHTPRDS